MPSNAAGPPGLPSPEHTSNAKSLLWTYQVSRENKALTDSLMKAKAQLDETENFAKTIKKCLDDLLDTIHSLAHIFDSEAQTDDDKHQLLLLRRELQHTLGPLCAYGKTLVHKNKKLVQCIATLEGLEDLAREMSADVEDTPSAPGTPCPNPKFEGSEPFFSAATSPIPTTSRTTASNIKDNPATPKQPQTKKDPIDPLFATIMQQRSRSLDEYFDEANAYRRQRRPLTPVIEKALVEAFIAGCDDKVYGRRLTHNLRKKEFTWTWLTHEVQFLVMEERYMEKQKFAMEHQDEDGSVLWPDGSMRTRFMPLLPVTGDDLTPSDGED